MFAHVFARLVCCSALAVTLPLLLGCQSTDSKRADADSEDADERPRKKKKVEDGDEAPTATSPGPSAPDRAPVASGGPPSPARQDPAPPAPVQPEQPAPGAPAPLAPAAAPAPTIASPQPAPAAFSPVEPSVWKMAHKVFEGPFGPSPRSLIAIIEREDETYWVLVVGDDNKSWPAGPLAEPGIDRATKVPAISFFDADGNGTTDLLVMAEYTVGRGVVHYKNALLKWTPEGMRRLLKLEPSIYDLRSVADIKRKLGR